MKYILPDHTFPADPHTPVTADTAPLDAPDGRCGSEASEDTQQPEQAV